MAEIGFNVKGARRGSAQTRSLYKKLKDVKPMPSKFESTPREYLNAVAKMLSAHPSALREFADLEETIEGLLSKPVLRDVPGNLDEWSPSEQEIVVKAKDENIRYQKLSRRITAINAALTWLDEEDLYFIELVFWRELKEHEMLNMLKIDHVSFFRWKCRILNDVLPFVMENWSED